VRSRGSENEDREPRNEEQNLSKEPFPLPLKISIFYSLFVQGRLIFSRFLLTHSSHSIRYVMKNRATDEALFVVVITLKPKEGEGEKAVEKKEEAAMKESEDLD
jgi:hypothetical protein